MSHILSSVGTKQVISAILRILTRQDKKHGTKKCNSNKITTWKAYIYMFS